MLTSDYQKLEPGSFLRLIEVDASEFGGGVYRYHNYNQVVGMGLFDGFMAGTELYQAGDESLLAGADLQGVTLDAWVSAADTVSVKFTNNTGAAVDLVSATLRARVEKA